MKLICIKFDWLDWIHSIRDIFNVEMRAREISKRKKFYASNDTQQYCVPFYLATNAIRIKKYRNDFSSLSYLHYSYIYSNCAIFVASRRFYANYVGYSVVWTRTYRNLHERRIYMSWKPGNAREINAHCIYLHLSRLNLNLKFTEEETKETKCKMNRNSKNDRKCQGNYCTLHLPTPFSFECIHLYGKSFM